MDQSCRHVIRYIIFYNKGNLMKILKMLIAISFSMLVAACGGGGGGGGSTVTPADFSGTWTASEGGTTLLYSVVQTGSSFTMTRTSPALAGVTYTGAVSGNSALVTTYINNIQAATSTLILNNDTTATMTVNTCNPPQGYTCAAPGSTVTVTRTNNQSTAPADFSGTWTGNASGTTFVYSVVQTGTSFNMTRTTPVLTGVSYTGVVTGNSALVTTYINAISAGTSTLTLVNDTTATMTVNTCTPPQGYTCAAPGSTVTVTRSVATLQTFPLDAAYTKAMTTGVTLNGTAIDGQDTYTMSIVITPATDDFFEGAVSKKSIEYLTLKKNGAVVGSDTMSAYFSINPLTMKGAIYSDGTYAVQTSNTGSLPTSAKVGDSGALGTLTLFANSSKATVMSTTQTSWSLEGDTASTAYGCENSVVRDAVGTQTGTSAGCYKIDTNGNVLAMRYTITVSGKTLVFN